MYLWLSKLPIWRIFQIALDFYWKNIYKNHARSEEKTSWSFCQKIFMKFFEVFLKFLIFWILAIFWNFRMRFFYGTPHVDNFKCSYLESRDKILSFGGFFIKFWPIFVILEQNEILKFFQLLKISEVLISTSQNFIWSWYRNLRNFEKLKKLLNFILL